MSEDFKPGSDPPNDGVVRFGNFEVDLRSGELLSRGRKIKMYGQPLALLITLLERPGEVVTREELQKKLWASDTFVDFEHGINTAINKLRDTLGDKAERPRYIETLPRRGYRFIGQIAPPTDVRETPTTADHVLTSSEEERAIRVSKRNRWKLWTIVSVPVLVALLLAGAWLSVYGSGRAPDVLSYRQLTRDGQSKGAPPCVVRSSVVTDGPRIYFSNSSATLVQVSSSGGEVQPIATPFQCFGISDISPDKTELLGFVARDSNAIDQPLWSLSLTTGQGRRMGNITGSTAAWSADGQKIAYAKSITGSPGTEAFVASPDGTNEQRVARFDRAYIHRIRWSPDGTRLRFIVVSDSFTPWEVRVDGTSLHALDSFPGREVLDAFWTPNGRYSIYVAAGKGSGVPEFWTVSETGSWFHRAAKPVQLTSGAMGFFDTTVSPDGKHLYGITAQLPRGSLVRYDPVSKRLEPFLSGISADQVDVSPDGKWVAYVSFPDGTLWKCRPDGSQRTPVTQPSLMASLPRWSPDGKSIAFAGRADKPPLKIYLVSADGGEAKVISEGSDHLVSPTWMQDGKTLVFGDSQFAAKPMIHTLDLSTGKQGIVPGSEGLYDPFVSPDGRFILGHDTPGNHKIMLFDERTQKWSELLDIRKHSGFSGLGYPHWSSDGKYVYGTVITAGMHSFAVYRVNMTTRKLDGVIPFQVPGGTTGLFGPLVKVLPDGSPTVMRDLSGQEIYAIDVEWP